jgi:hypothetical protein
MAHGVGALNGTGAAARICRWASQRGDMIAVGQAMRNIFRRGALVLCLGAILGFAQQPQEEPPVAPPASPPEVRLPNGKLQRDEILKAEHQENLKDAAKLVDLAQDLRESLERDDRYVLSLSTLKKTDEIEKLVKKIRSRLRHD